MGSLVARLKNGKAAKQIVLLSSGSLIAQLLTFAMSPVLTRLYSTEVIGLFTFVLSIVSAFSGVICLRYDVSIVTADKESFGPLFKACVIITVALSLLIGVGSFVVCWLFEMVEPSSLWTIVFVFPLLLVAGAINILNGCNNRNEEYKAISDAYVGRSVAQNAIMVGAGLVAPNAAVLLVSQLVGQFAGIKLQLRALHDSWKDALRVNSDAVRRAVVDNRAQALFSTPATLLNAASYSLVSLCIGNVYGMGVLGLYSISFRVLGVPLAVFSSNIARVHCKLSEREMGSSGSYFKSTLKMLLASLAIILPISALLFFFSPPAFSVLFGPEWEEAGVYVQILVPMFLLRFLAGSIGYGFFLSRKQWQETVIQLLLLITLVGVLAISVACGADVITFLVALSATWSVVYLTEIGLFVVNSKRGA